MKILDQFDTDSSFLYENGFYLTTKHDRIGKLLAHYELYKEIAGLPGDIVECGVFKGSSLIRFTAFRELLENCYSRKIIGFDIFGKFPETSFDDDKRMLERFISAAGDQSISKDELDQVLAFKGIANVELVMGDINQTVPDYSRNHPEFRIALLHIDTDIYEPAVTILNSFYDHVVSGGLIVLDDYGTFPGETKAVEEFIKDKGLQVRKHSFYKIPSFIVKP